MASWLMECLFGSSSSSRGAATQPEPAEALARPNPAFNPIKLDTTFLGKECVVVKSGVRLCGSGAALGNGVLAQDKSYWEVILRNHGVWGVGIATRQANLDHVPLGNCPFSWVLRNDGTFWHNGRQEGALDMKFEESDCFSFTYDHVVLRISLNNKPLDFMFSSARGEVYPVLYVGEGAILDAAFRDFMFKPPQGYGEILQEKSIF